MKGGSFGFLPSLFATLSPIPRAITIDCHPERPKRGVGSRRTCGCFCCCSFNSAATAHHPCQPSDRPHTTPHSNRSKLDCSFQSERSSLHESILSTASPARLRLPETCVSRTKSTGCSYISPRILRAFVVYVQRPA